MNPRAAALLILGAIVLLAAIIALIVWLVGRQAGVRRRDYKLVVAERSLLARAVVDISTAADLYRDIDSPLASQVRTIVRDVDQKRLDLTR